MARNEPEGTPPLSAVQRKIAASGWRAADVARKTGLSEASISLVIRGVKRWPNIQQAIADCMDTTPPALFGDLCHPSLRRRPDNSHVGGREHDATHPPRTAEVAA